jgi:hypothetical protein
VKEELIGVICLNLCACSSGRNNSSIHLFTRSGHEPKSNEKKIRSKGTGVSPEMMNPAQAQILRLHLHLDDLNQWLDSIG